MMVKIVFWSGSLAVAATLLFFVLSMMSCTHKPERGLQQGQLSSCPSTPNCVCSEFPGQKSAYLPPLELRDDPTVAWPQAREILVEMGGEVLVEESDYLHVVFKTSFFRFVDDMELRLDIGNNLIHFRSASRVGYSDMGVNARRVERFKKLFGSR